jgi:hypothetical protein
MAHRGGEELQVVTGLDHDDWDSPAEAHAEGNGSHTLAQPLC